jgi:aryl-alcohol dehydrogenase-like predicted oxidoreductase
LGAGSFGEAGWGATLEESRRIFDVYFSAGGRFVDVANVYAAGQAEQLVGEFVRGRRDEVVIATKYTASTRDGDVNAWGNHRKSLRQSLSASLARLGTDYVDILWVHAWDEVTPLEETMRALDDEVRAGRTLYVGISNAPAWVVARANTIAEFRGWSSFVGIQIEYNLATRWPEYDLIPMALNLGLQFMSWSPLGGGLLAGSYVGFGQTTGARYRTADLPAQKLAIAASVVDIARQVGETPATVSLAWLRQREFPIIPILGARTALQIEETLRRVDFSLSAEFLQQLDEASTPGIARLGESMASHASRSYFHGNTQHQMIGRHNWGYARGSSD